MKKITLYDSKLTKIKDLNLNTSLSDFEPHMGCVRDSIILTQNSLRQGTKKTKTRAEVSGGGRKPWRQKGTGRARQGSIRSPQWVGGGVAHGVLPQSFKQKMNKKEKNLALKSAFVLKLKDMVVIDKLEIKKPKTQEFMSLLKNLKLEEEKLLIIVSKLEDNLILSSRNIPTVLVLEASEINVLDLIDNSKILITEDAFNEITNREAFK